MKTNAIGSPAAASRSRTRGWRAATGPIPVMTSRSGRPPATDGRRGLEIGMLRQKLRDLRLDGLGRTARTHVAAEPR